MSAQTLEIARKLLQGLATRNPETLGSLFADHVDWYIPGDQYAAPWLGRRSGKPEILQFFSLLWEHTEPLSAQVDQIVADGDSAIIAGEFSTRMLQTMKVVDSLFFIRITVQDDLIVRYRLLEDSFAVSAALRD